jgi:hypothetical protein
MKITINTPLVVSKHFSLPGGPSNFSTVSDFNHTSFTPLAA